MSTRVLLAVVGATVALAGAAALAADRGHIRLDPSDRSEGDRRPNVVVIMTDDQTVDELHAMERTRRRFDERGVSFTNSFASFPLCCPSRVTFLTGQHAHNHGVESNKEDEGGGYAGFDDDDSLPRRLERGGYRTGFVGKYLNGYELEDVPGGWTRWLGKKGPYLDYRLTLDGEEQEHGSRKEDYETDVLTAHAVDFIGESAELRKPFFLWLSFAAPHGERGGGERRYNPRPAPRHRGAFDGRRPSRSPSFDERDVSDKPSFVAEAKRLSDRRERIQRNRHRSRLASLLAVDEAVDEVFEALRKEGERDRTYVIFTSDNGYMFGEHRQTKKSLLYEESVRVPLLMAGPGVPAGERRDQLVANVDLAATIYDATGVEPGREQDGASLLPVARDPAEGDGRQLLLENRRSQGVRDRDAVYIEHDPERAGEPEEFELYDLRNDPHQLENLLNPATGELVDPNPERDELLARLDARLDELRNCDGRSCR